MARIFDVIEDRTRCVIDRRTASLKWVQAIFGLVPR